MPDELKQTNIPNPSPQYMTEEQTRNIISESLSSYGGLFRVRSGEIQSGNYVSGTSGWNIDALGNCEFQSGTFRGTINATAGTFSGNITVTGSLTGGTIQTAAAGTGVNRVVLNGTTNALEFVNNTTVQCSLTTDGTNKMILTASGQIKFDLGTDAQTWYMDSTGFYPMTDKNGNLGSSSKEWADVYSQDYYSGSSKGTTQTWDFDAGEAHRFVFVSGLFISHTKL